MTITLTINTADCGPRDWEALAAFVAVKRGLLDSAGVIAPPAINITLPSPPPPPPPASEALIATAVAAASTGSAPPPPPPAGVDLDVGGLPWDARIHAGGKSKNADGTWRAKRGVDIDTVVAVTAELRSIMAAPVVTLDPAAAFGGAVPLPPSDAPPASIAVAADVPPPPPADAATVLPAAVASPVVNEFAELMKLVTGRQAAGTLTTDIVTALAQQLGLTGIVDLAKRPDLIPAFKAMLP